MTTRPGYLVTITGFIPADINDMDAMLGLSNDIGNLKVYLYNNLFHSDEYEVRTRFVARHKSPPPAAPPATDDTQSGPPTLAAPQQPAGSTPDSQDAGQGGGQPAPASGEPTAGTGDGSKCRHPGWTGPPNDLRCSGCGRPASEIPADELLDASALDALRSANRKPAA